MDQLQPPRGRSPAAVDQQTLDIKQSHSPSHSPVRAFDASSLQPASTTPSIGLGLALDPSSQTTFATTQADFNTYTANNTFLTTTQPALIQQDLTFDPNQSFADQLKGDPAFNTNFLGPQPSFTGEDFTIFPTSAPDQLATPLFGQQPQPPQVQQQPQQSQQQSQQPQQPSPQSHQEQLPQQTPDMATMATSQALHSPTPPHLLGIDSLQPGSAHQSPLFNTQQFVQQPVGRHSRHVSLGPEAALLPGQEWNSPQFQGHRRNGSEFSDASSIGGHSPSLVSQDAFPDPSERLDSSPMLRPDETGDVYQELNGMNSFSISSNHSGRSPSPHSPAISPRIIPQTIPEGSPANSGFMLQGQNDGYSPYLAATGPLPEAFPQLPTTGADLTPQMPQMPAPTIAIEYAPNTAPRLFEGKPVMDTDALTPPENRGRSRRRAITDPFNGGGLINGRPAPNTGSLSPNLGANLIPRTDARSLSPLERSGSAVAGNRRRLSTSAVPNNVMALRLADPEYAAAGSGEAGGAGGGGGTKRAQKHPATFQCTLCPKRFTRAYNLRSHLRTHTDERPFVCNFCGKAFARQHDRKRHEGLHSGEKKFVCKGELKTGGEWGCGRRFARADALGRHFRSEAGRICIKPLLDEEFLERQRQWQEQHMQEQQHMQAQAAAQQQNLLLAQSPQLDASGYPMDGAGNYTLPAALLAQYPALAQVNWSNVDISQGASSGIEDDLSGRSSFDASDFDDGEEGGYVSGPGTGFGEGGMGENFGEIGYASDYGGR